MDTLLAIGLGLGLAAASGLRVFLPILILGLSDRLGLADAGPALAWASTTPALIAFGIAALAEVLGYTFPVVDHALDTIATPAAVISGAVLTASQLGMSMDTPVGSAAGWIAGAAAGGGVAAAVQSTSVGVRAASTLTTAAIANPILSALENIGALVLSILSVLLPAVVGLGLLLVLLMLVVWRRRRRRRASLALA